jgi:hypothetical protein
VLITVLSIKASNVLRHKRTGKFKIAFMSNPSFAPVGLEDIIARLNTNYNNKYEKL